MNPETAPCINGPKLAAWLRERDRLPLSLVGARRRGSSGDPIESLYRRLHAWSNGEQARVEVADYWLTMIGCHLSELPEDFFEERNPRPRKNKNPNRLRALQLLGDGLSVHEIARGLKVDRRTVGRWRDAA